MKKSIAIMALAMIVPTMSQAENLFLETFEDGSLTDDSPLTWQIFPGFNVGESSIVDGDLVVKQNGGHSFVPFATTPSTADVSLKTVLRTEDYMTIIARANPNTGTAYGGGIRSTGEVHIERTHPGTGAGVSTFLTTAQTELRPAEEDVFLQFDLVGSQLDLFAWRVGDEKPAEPSASVTDTTHVDPGLFGFIKCCGTESSTVQFLQVADGPISDLAGDYNSNLQLDDEDIELLSLAIGTQDVLFDASGDGTVNESDHTVWVKDLANTWIGDANLDGSFDSADLTRVFQANKYQKDQATSWSEGDWTGDQRFNSSDLIAAFKDNGFEAGARSPVNAVPEPSSLSMFVLGLLAVLRRKTKRSAGADSSEVAR